MGSDDLKRRFGGVVQTLREAAGLTQEQLAEKIDRSVDTVSNIERGANSTRIETAGRIADALGVTLPELFEFQDGGEARSRRRDISSLARAMADLDDDAYRSVARMLSEALKLGSRARISG